MSWQGKFYWNELMTTDAAAARAFFGKTIGWTFTEMPMADGPYTVCHQDGVPAGGIMAMPAAMAGTPSHWMSYLAVDDIDATLETLVASGGTIVRPAFDVPGVGRIAIVQDPTGAYLGMMTPTPVAQG
jgi:hypothetical protein